MKLPKMKLPTVTQILSDLQVIDYSFLSFADALRVMERGRYVDQAVELLFSGQGIDPAWLSRHPECAAYIDGAKAAMESSPLLSPAMRRDFRYQIEIEHVTERYVGHPDIVHPDNLTIEVKTGTYPTWVPLQTAAYCPTGRGARYCLLLTGEGAGWKLIPHLNWRDYEKWLTLVRAWWIREGYRNGKQ